MSTILHARLRKLTILVSALICVALLHPRLSARAQLEAERPGFTVAPALVDIPVAREEDSTIEIIVRNLSDQFVPVQVSTTNFEPSDELGHTFFYEDERAAFNAREWFSLSETDFIFEPHEEKRIEVTIVPPEDAEAGSHFAAVLLTPLVPPASPTGQEVVVQAQVAIPFFLTVPGEVTIAGDITKLETPLLHFGGPLPITVRVENRGNVHVKVEGTMTLRGMTGRETTIPLEQGIVFPGRGRVYSARWEPRWPLGRYHVTATVNYKGTTLSAGEILWALPLSWVLIGLFAIMAGAVYRRTKGRWGLAWALFMGKFDTLPVDTLEEPVPPSKQLTEREKPLYDGGKRRKQKNGQRQKRAPGNR